MKKRNNKYKRIVDLWISQRNKFQWNWDCRLRLSIVEASFTLHSACAAVSEVFCKHAERENGLQDLMEDND